LLAGIAAVSTVSIALLLAWRAAPVSVTLVVDGSSVGVTTRSGTVGALLVERGIPIEAGDMVSPAPARRLRGGDTVTVDGAREVRLRLGSTAVRVRTLARTARAVLSEGGISIEPGDRVKVGDRYLAPDSRLPRTPRADLASRPGPTLPGSLARSQGFGGRVAHAASPEQSEPPEVVEEPLEIAVFRPTEVLLEEDGIQVRMRLAGETVGEALELAGIGLWPEDMTWPPRDRGLRGVVRISLSRATPFTVEADGEVLQTRAIALDVGAALDAASMPLRGRDYSIPPAETALRPGMHVRVVRVAEDFLVRQVEIPFGTDYQPDAELALDERRVLEPGVPGRKTQRVRIVYEDGEEISREVVEDTVDRQPVRQKVAYGTRIVWRTVDTPEGPRRYWRKLRVYATSYSASRAGTPTTVPWYGLTRLGWKMRHGIVAVDPKIIPMRTNLFVPEYGLGVAGDTGGGIRNYHIDLGYDDDNYQGWHWWVEAYLLEPLPPADEIPWLLP